MPWMETCRRIAVGLTVVLAIASAAGCALNASQQMEPRVVEIVVEHNLTQQDILTVYIQSPRRQWAVLGRVAPAEARVFTYEATHPGQHRMVAVRPGGEGRPSRRGIEPEGESLASSDRFVIRSDTERVIWSLRSDQVSTTAGGR